MAEKTTLTFVTGHDSKTKGFQISWDKRGGDLFTGCVGSGVEVARICFGLEYRTWEVSG